MAHPKVEEFFLETPKIDFVLDKNTCTGRTKVGGTELRSATQIPSRGKDLDPQNANLESPADPQKNVFG